MKRTITAALLSLTLLVGGFAFSGCSTSTESSSAASALTANRAYMSQVNEIMDEFFDSYEAFVEAVSSGGAVNVRTQADAAYAILDKLAEVEAPEDLKDIKASYLDGTAKLRKALDDYIALYTDIEAGNFNKEDTAKRMEEIQNVYNEGVEILEKGDQSAAEL